MNKGLVFMYIYALNLFFNHVKYKKLLPNKLYFLKIVFVCRISLLLVLGTKYAYGLVKNKTRVSVLSTQHIPDYNHNYKTNF